MPSQQIHYPDVKASFALAGLVLLSLILFSPITFLLDGILGKDASTLIYYVVAMGVPLLFANRRRKIKTGINNFNLKFSMPKIIVLVMLAIWGLMVGVVSPITNLIPMSDYIKEIYLELATNNSLLSYLVIVIAAPFLEELIFRGIILDGLLRKYSALKSIVISSFLFGFVHLNPWQFIAAFIIGCFAGWVYYKTRNLFLPILIHMTNNFLSFLGMHFMDAEAMLNSSIKEMYNGYFNYALSILIGVSIALFCISRLVKEFDDLKIVAWREDVGLD